MMTPEISQSIQITAKAESLNVPQVFAKYSDHDEAMAGLMIFSEKELSDWATFYMNECAYLVSFNEVEAKQKRKYKGRLIAIAEVLEMKDGRQSLIDLCFSIGCSK